MWGPARRRRRMRRGRRVDGARRGAVESPSAGAHTQQARARCLRQSLVVPHVSPPRLHARTKQRPEVHGAQLARALGERGGRYASPKYHRVDLHGRANASRPGPHHNRRRRPHLHSPGEQRWRPLRALGHRTARQVEPGRRRAGTREVAGTVGESGRGTVRGSREGVEAIGGAESAAGRRGALEGCHGRPVRGSAVGFGAVRTAGVEGGGMARMLRAQVTGGERTW